METLRAAPFAVALVHVSTLQPYKLCQIYNLYSSLKYLRGPKK